MSETGKKHPCDCLSCKISILLNEHFGGGEGIPEEHHEEALSALADVSGILLSAGDLGRFHGFIERTRVAANETARKRYTDAMLRAFGLDPDALRN